MADLISMLAAVAGSGGGADPNFNQTVLLLHGDGTNGAQNNTFLDSSTNNFTITRNGNTTQGTFSPFSVGAGEWSNYFDGTGDYLSVAYNSALVFDSGNFTVEAFVYITANAAQNGSGVRAATIASNITSTAGWELTIDGNASTTGTSIVFVNRINSTTAYSITAVTTVNQNQWNHIAVVRNSTTTTIYLNGISVGSGTLTNQSITSSNPLWIGRQNVTNYTHDFPGYISNFRIVKGTAVYTSAFTPSTTPLTAITNTSLLTCQSNRFVDNSTNAFAITRNGDVRVTPFSPFAPTAAYSAGTNGGSGYFDGTGDYLNFTGTNFDIGTGALTIEAWVYLNAYGFSGIISTWNSTNTGQGFSLALDSSGKPEFNYGNGSVGQGVSVAASSAIPLNTWVHLAATKGAGSGGTMTLYVNGVSVGTPVTTTKSIDREAVVIGRYYQDLNLYYLNGYISNIRVSDTVRSISIPTAPYTSDANTLFLANFTNAGIIDNTGKNNLETVGNAQIDTTTKKYGTGSLEFDGTGDWLTMPNNENFQLGSGNFTIEFWAYTTSFASQTYTPICGVWNANIPTDSIASYYVAINAFNDTKKLGFSYRSSGANVDLAFGTTTNATGVWDHYAICRSGNLLYAFKNGTLLNSGGTSITATLPIASATPFTVGKITNGNEYNGYIDDLRITKGVARYTAAFTPPTAAFPNE